MDNQYQNHCQNIILSNIFLVIKKQMEYIGTLAKKFTSAFINQITKLI